MNGWRENELSAESDCESVKTDRLSGGSGKLEIRSALRGNDSDEGFTGASEDDAGRLRWGLDAERFDTSVVHPTDKLSGGPGNFKTSSSVS
jgi:hypothetical protein